jgi:hypothetical protein
MRTVLELYEKLKPKLGEAEARALLEFVETSVQEKAATKDDLERSASSLRDEIHRTEAVLRKEIQEVKVDLIKWSFAFWLGAVAVLSGIMLGLLRAFPGK